MPLPPRLANAKTVGIYSPSGSVLGEPVEKMRLFEQGVDRLKTLGFDIRLSSHCLSKQYHMSAVPESRAADLFELVRDPDVDIIVPTIGGHVAAQLLGLIDFEEIAQSGKALFGFSDNSILPLVTSSQTGAITFHTLCDVTFGFGRFGDHDFCRTERSFLAAVRDCEFDLRSPSWQALTPGRAEGVLFGGNLTAITSLLGTRWSPDWRHKIMFWESVDPLHRVVSQLTQLSNAGVLDQISGMIVGRISTLKESFYSRDEVLPVEVVLGDLGRRRGIPIVIEADVGHDVENVTVPLGASAILNASNREPIVEISQA